MEKKNAKLEKVSKYGGLILDDNPNEWINPTAEAKDRIKENLENIKSWEGKEVIVQMIDEHYYSGIQLGDGGTSEDQNSEEAKPKMQKTGTNLLNPKHIINLQGKEFVTHSGLLEVAHKIGIESIQTELISPIITDVVVFKATVKLSDGMYCEAHGDASEKNTNEKIAPHMLRMAETRAVNRALRFATNIGMCSIDELGEVKKGEDDS